LFNHSIGLLSIAAIKRFRQAHYAVQNVFSIAAVECFTNMNRLQRESDVADVVRFGAARVLVTFITMAVAEWRKLVAEVKHAFAGKRTYRGTTEEKRHDD
jgi:hypothetical protein